MHSMLLVALMLPLSVQDLDLVVSVASDDGALILEGHNFSHTVVMKDTGRMFAVKGKIKCSVSVGLLAVASDKSVLAIIGPGPRAHNTLEILECRPGGRRVALYKSKTEMYGLTISPDSKLVAVHTNRHVLFISTKSGEEVSRIRTDLGGEFMRFSPDGKFLAMGGNNGTVGLYSLSQKKLVWEKRLHRSIVHCITFSHDSQHLASGSDDSTIHMVSAQSGESQLHFRAHRTSVAGLVFSRDSKVLVSAGRDGRVVMWNIKNGKAIHEHHVRFQSSSITLSCSKLNHAVTTSGGVWAIFDIKTGKSLHISDGKK